MEEAKSVGANHAAATDDDIEICFRHIRIRRINHHLDRQGEFQQIGNRCCTSWHRSIFYERERDSGHRICN